MACAASLPALAFNPQPDPPGIWSMVGLVADQSARLSVHLWSPRGARANPCTVTINFLDSYGNKLTEATTLVLLPAVITAFDLKGSELRLPTRTDRVQFRAHVQVLHNPPGDRSCKGVVANLEVFDTATGHTTVLSNPSFVPPDPY